MASTVALAGIVSSTTPAISTRAAAKASSKLVKLLPIRASSQPSADQCSRRALLSLLATAAPAVLYAKEALAAATSFKVDGPPPPPGGLRLRGRSKQAHFLALQKTSSGAAERAMASPVSLAGIVSTTTPVTSTPITAKPGKYRGQAKTTGRLDSVAVLPLLSLAAKGSHYELTTFYNDSTLDEKTLKNIYLCFSLFFVWGCCVFGSMKEPFYDSDVYRDAGGDGSGNWLYKLEEEEEVQAREELWREELAREIEERVEELRELEEGEKKKELV